MARNRILSLQCHKSRKISTVQLYKLCLSFMVISAVYRSFIRNKSAFIKYCLTQWISKLHGSFEIHLVRQYWYIHWSGRHSKHNNLQDQTTCQMSRAWQIVIFLTLLLYLSETLTEESVLLIAHGIAIGLCEIII